MTFETSLPLVPDAPQPLSATYPVTANTAAIVFSGPLDTGQAPSASAFRRYDGNFRYAGSSVAFGGPGVLAVTFQGFGAEDFTPASIQYSGTGTPLLGADGTPVAPFAGLAYSAP